MWLLLVVEGSSGVRVRVRLKIKSQRGYKKKYMKKKTKQREDKGGQECNQVGLRKGKAESEHCNKMEMRSNHEKVVHVWRDTTNEKRKTGEGCETEDMVLRTE